MICIINLLILFSITRSEEQTSSPSTLSVYSLPYDYPQIALSSSESTKDQVLNIAPIHSFPEESISKALCYWVEPDTYKVWDLTPLKRKNDLEYMIEEKTGTEKRYIAYNICGNTIIRGTQLSQVAALDENFNYLQTYAGDSDNFNEFYRFEESSGGQGIDIKMSTGEKCSSDNKMFQVYWRYTCNKSLDKEKAIFKSVDRVDDCIISLSVDSYHGCAVGGQYYLSYYFNEHPTPFGIIAIIIGLYLTFVADRLPVVTLYLVLLSGFFYLILAINLIIQSATGYDADIEYLLTSLVGGVALAAALFVVIQKKHKGEFVPTLVNGMITGYLFSVLFYLSCLHRIHYNNHLVYGISVGFFVIVFGISGLQNYKLLAFGLPFLGCYLIAKGISFWAGSFPNEMLVVDLVRQSEWWQLDKILNNYIWAYLLGWLAASCGASFLYYHRQKGREEVNWLGIQSGVRNDEHLIEGIE